MQGVELALEVALRAGRIAPAQAQHLLNAIRARPAQDLAVVLSQAGAPAALIAELLNSAAAGTDSAGGSARGATRADASARAGRTPEPFDSGRDPRAGSSTRRDPAGSSRRGRGSLLELLRSSRRGEAVRGAQFGPYWVEGELGRGAMGAVFRARHLERGWDVALKVLLKGDQATEKQRKRLIREARATMALDHPAIIHVFDAGEVDGTPYMAMELVEGETLADRLTTLHVRPLVQIVAHLARGLEQAHALGIIHRDVKPENVLLREDDGRAVLTDFGIVRDLNTASSLTKSGAAVGTPAYMAPEQINGSLPSPATDVHALGAILYEGLTGQLPFEGESVLGLFQAIVNDVPERPSRLNPRVPKALDEIVLASLAKSPGQRPRHGGELAERLEHWLSGGQASPARSDHPWAPIVAGSVIVAASLLAVLVILLTPPGEQAAHQTPAPTSIPTGSPSANVAAATPSQTLTLKPGALQGKDAFVRNDNLFLNDNSGSGAELRAGDRNTGGGGGDFRSLLEFDLSRVPAHAQLRRATLSLWFIRSDFADKHVALQVQKVVATRDLHGQGRAQTPWSEGTSTFDAFIDGVVWDGDSTALQRLQESEARSRRPDLTQPRTDDFTDYGLGNNGVVAQAALSSSQEAAWIHFDVTAMVREWLAGEDNFGLLLRHSNEGRPFRDGCKVFASSDHPDPAVWPSLELEWDGPSPAEEPAREALEAEALRRAGRILDELSIMDPRAPEAMEVATRAITAAPFDGEGYYRRARVSLGLGDVNRALVDLGLMDAVQRPFYDAGALEERAAIRVALGQLSPALDDLEAARRVLPADPSLESYYAQLLVQANRLEEASQVIDALPKESLPWNGLLVKGQCLLLQGRREEAADWLEAAALAEARREGGQPRSLFPRIEQAANLMALGRYEEAALAFDHALEIDPTSKEAGAGARVARRRAAEADPGER